MVQVNENQLNDLLRVVFPPPWTIDTHATKDGLVARVGIHMFGVLELEGSNLEPETYEVELKQLKKDLAKVLKEHADRLRESNNRPGSGLNGR